MKKETTYQTPLVKVYEIDVEQGFAISGSGPDSDDSEFGSYPGY